MQRITEPGTGTSTCTGTGIISTMDHEPGKAGDIATVVK